MHYWLNSKDWYCNMLVGTIHIYSSALLNMKLIIKYYYFLKLVADD